MYSTFSFDSNHFAFEHVGTFLDCARRRVGISIENFCAEGGIGKDTYYKIKKGKDCSLNFYVRMLSVLEMYFSEEEFRDIVWEFMLLARAEVCRARHRVLSPEMLYELAKWE